MIYDKSRISQLKDEIAVYVLYEQHGHGTMEFPHKRGQILRTLKCSEFDAFVLAEAMNIERNGLISSRTSWETPVILSRKIENLGKSDEDLTQVTATKNITNIDDLVGRWETISWEDIGTILTNYFHICGCQRKLKSIIDALFNIYTKSNEAFDTGKERNFTGAEWLVIAILDSNSTAISHGSNIEYPMVNKDDSFWKFILSVKNNPNLNDN